jgi:transcription termination factor Rho
MSHFTKLKTQIKDKQALLLALNEMGFTKEQIELYDKPVKLEGYEANGGADHRAEIIVRKKHLANAYNDIGFRRQADGSYEAALSDMEMSNRSAARNAITKGLTCFGKDWMQKLNQRYALQTIKLQAQRLGYMNPQVEESADGEIFVTVTPPV